MKTFLLFSAAILLLGACNSYKSKQAPQEGDQVMPAAIDYAFVNAKVFQPRCVRCHSSGGGNKGDVNLENYQNVILHLEMIADVALVQKVMPPKRAGGPLGDYEQEVLRLWIESGAPLEAGGEPAPTPTPQPKPELPPPPGPVEPPPAVKVEPTWDSIYANIIEPKCLECHQAGGKAEDYPLGDRLFVTDATNLLVKPGAPDESDIYEAITRTDKFVMPPPKTGVTLSEQEKEAVRIWILNGAKD